MPRPPSRAINISKLQAAGCVDTDACAAKLNAINIQLTQLRRERRRLLEHDDIEDTIGRLHQTADAIKAGPERLDTFDEDLFEDLSARQTYKKLYEVMNEVLSERERMVITLRYGLGDRTPLTQREIAAKCGISRSYVSRIEKKALAALQQALQDYTQTA